MITLDDIILLKEEHQQAVARVEQTIAALEAARMALATADRRATSAAVALIELDAHMAVIIEQWIAQNDDESEQATSLRVTEGADAPRS